MKYKILCCDGYAGPGLEQLKADDRFLVQTSDPLKEAELRGKIGDCAALVVRSATQVTAKAMDSAKDLKIIARAGIGTDNIDLKAASERGIFVINAPSGNTRSTAELTLGMLLSLARHIPQAAGSMAAGKWEKKRFKGMEVAHKTLAVIGLGRIGKEVSRLARAFQMKVVGYDPFQNEEQFKAAGVLPLTLDEILSQADFITCHTPLSPETENLIAAKQLKMMKPTACLINCARGGIINEKDLALALKEKQIGGAALDVFSQEPLNEPLFQGLDNCITTPHLGASTSEAQATVGLEIAQALIEFFNQGLTYNAVNLPGASQEELSQLGPELALAESLGRLAGQLQQGPLHQITLTASGRKSPLLTLAAVKGCLSHAVSQPPTYVNVKKRAAERGIKIKEEFQESKSKVAELCLQLEGQNGPLKVCGKLDPDQKPRLSRYQNFHLALDLKGNFIFIENADRPGVIGRICQILGDHQLNIGQMQNVREKKGDLALTVLQLDETVPGAALDIIGAEDTVMRTLTVNI